MAYPTKGRPTSSEMFRVIGLRSSLDPADRAAISFGGSQETVEAGKRSLAGRIDASVRFWLHHADRSSGDRVEYPGGSSPALQLTYGFHPIWASNSKWHGAGVFWVGDLLFSRGFRAGLRRAALRAVVLRRRRWTEADGPSPGTQRRR